MAFDAAFEGIILALQNRVAQVFAILLMHHGAARHQGQGAYRTSYPSQNGGAVKHEQTFRENRVGVSGKTCR